MYVTFNIVNVYDTLVPLYHFSKVSLMKPVESTEAPKVMT